MRQNVAVLLGAGASVDAGLPLTTQLAEQLVDRANNTLPNNLNPPDWVKALNFVYGAQIGYQVEDGGNPLTAVNIERLISALRLLQNSEDHEVAPFVAAWKPGALGVGTADSSSILASEALSSISRAILDGKEFFERDRFAKAISNIAENAVRGSNPTAFKEAETWTLAYLSELLGTLKDVDYLHPLAALATQQRDGLDILSLNYDLAIETLAEQEDIEIDRGIDRWKPGYGLQFEPQAGRINLYKMHGSLDWTLQSPGKGARPPVVVANQKRTTDPNTITHIRSKTPWIVVGDREKLSTDGPMLAIMRAAEDALKRCSKLVVIGYSFGDKHVNHMVRDWMLGDDDRTLVIVDPSWDGPEAGDFQGSLIDEYGADFELKRESRLVVLEGYAKDSIEDAISATPVPRNESSAEIEVKQLANEALRIDLTLSGALHKNVSLNLYGNSRERGVKTNVEAFTSIEDLEAMEDIDSWGQSNASLERWKNGEKFSIFARTREHSNIELSFTGRRIDSPGWLRTSTPLPAPGRKAFLLLDSRN